ncbi:MAG: Qat anti-phage system TatD family nuclease QatD [Methylocystis sp.]
MIDFHCHLDLYSEPFSIAAECRSQELYVLSVTTTPSAWPTSRTLSNGSDKIRVALGLHPQIAHLRISELELFDELLPLTKYVGEIGLDGDPQLRKFHADQLRALEHILRSCAKAGGKILSVHSRRATTQVMALLAAYVDAGVAILHWFSGSERELDRAIEQGCWFSVGTLMMQTKKGRALVSRMPRDRILTETDGPFAQRAGVALSPWDVVETEKLLAEIWQVSIDECRKTLLGNLARLTRSVM